MQLMANHYREPILTEKVTSLMKLACDTFKQDVQVFFLSAELAERYIYIKESRLEKIEDPFLTVCVIIFIMSKYFGGGADLKIPIIEKFMLKISGINYNAFTIMQYEKEILSVLQYKLTFSTVMDDLDIFFEKFSREYRLKEVLRPLCTELLILIYCTRQQWFETLKILYKDDEDTFESLICSKLFLPAGILITAFKSTNYQFILDIDGLLQDLKVFTKIHPAHIHALSAIISDLMRE
ncbi:hypothetical protein HUJ04_007326 [Dendroctonus ponderosae]|nr:hypothetical protein HUJ04_007326 [Dendroctonus ponderosae]KAH1025336.1 hypothetical protein HUJ05_010078 [Dendroctonus ponderosae]